MQRASVCGFFAEKLPQTMEYLNETRREGSFGQDARDDVVAFWFDNQGAEQLYAEGKKMGVRLVLIERRFFFQNIDSTALPDPTPPPIFAHFPLRPSQQK